MADATYGPKTYRKQGGDEIVIASGGTLNLESGAIFQQDNKAAAAVMTVGTQATATITVAIQINDAEGTALAAVSALQVYLSSDSAGKDVEGTGPDSWAAGTDGSFYASGGDSVIAGLIVTESDGDMDLAITEASVDTFYLNVILPDGSISTSGAITFTSTT